MAIFLAVIISHRIPPTNPVTIILPETDEQRDYMSLLVDLSVVILQLSPYKNLTVERTYFCSADTSTGKH